jgi:hypothetical protein
MLYDWLQFRRLDLKFLEVRGNVFFIEISNVQTQHWNLMSPTHIHLVPRPEVPESLLPYSIHVYKKR